MKRFKTAVVIGKFYPPHRDHKHLIDTASAQTQDVTIIVCDEAAQTIPGELRAAWLREIHPDATVRVVRSPLAHDDSAGWARSTIKWLGIRFRCGLHLGALWRGLRAAHGPRMSLWI